MAERIGRVEFLVDLDGKNLPQQARRLGQKIGDAGGDAAGDEFNSTFNRKIANNPQAQAFAERLGSRGKLAGERFSTTFNNALKTNFRGIQSQLARILSDESAFSDFAKGFESVDQAVDQLRSNLERLTQEEVKYQDASGKTHRAMVLTEAQADRFSSSLDEMAESVGRARANQAALALETEDLQSRYARLQRSVGDGESFRKVAAEVGGTNRAFERLAAELEGAGRAAGANRIEIETYVDRLDSTRRAVDNVIMKEREHARSMEEAAERALMLERRQQGLGASLTKLSNGWSGLSHNTKQWTLIISAIAAGMQDIAVLSSAAGAGLLGLGGALTTAIGGGAGLITVLTTLSKDIGDLPPELREAAMELEGFKDSFSDLATVITTGAVSEMSGAFSSLEDTVVALNPAFSRLGSSVGVVFDDLASGLAEGSAGFEELEGLIDNAAEDFPALARATGTWLTSLTRGINRANPLTDQLIGYVQELGDRFDDFTQSDDFDTWVRNSMATFTEFGELLDATGRMLNDLVTPGAIERTQQLLDNLTDFMPHLGSLLDIVGRLDIFGLIALALAEFGDALEPLAAPMGQLADEVNDIAEVALPALADILGVTADAVAPLVQGFADLVGALPPEAIVGITGAVVGLAGALKLLKGTEALAGVANAALTASGNFGGLTLATGRVEQGAGRLRGTLAGFAGKAGIFGAAAAGTFLLVDALDNLSREMSDIDSVSLNAVSANKSLKDSYLDVTNAFLVGTEDTAQAIDDWSSALDLLDNGWARFTAGAGTAAEDSVLLARALNELSGPLAGLAQTDLPAAQDQFRAWADEIGATDQQVLYMLEHMPEFSDAVKENAAAQGELNTSADLVEAALGRQATTMGALATGADLAGASAGLFGEELMNVGADADESGLKIDALSGKLLGFNNAEITARESARSFQAAIDAASDSVAANGQTLDITTEAGRQNQAALDAIATSAVNSAGAIAQNTGSQEAANVAITDGRIALVNAAKQMGLSETAANQYADQLGLIPGDIETDIETPGMAGAKRDATDLKGRLDDVDGTYNATVNVTVRGGALAGLRAGLNSLPRTAIGGTFDGAQARIIGEAGPEAVVPLRRPLSQVDPSVRELSAVAQGISLPGSGSGPTRVNNIEAGAIVIQQAREPLATGVEVLDRLARNLN